MRRLLRTLAAQNPFYGPRLAAAGLNHPLEQLAEFNRRLPFTFKHELLADQQAHPPYGTDLTYPLQRYARYHQTSGSSGVPLRWLDTPKDWNHLLNNWEHIFAAAGLTAKDRLFFAFSFGPFLGFWTAFEAASRLNHFCLAGGSMSSTARLRAIRDNAITVLFCTPTYAIHLGEVAQAEGADQTGGRVRLMIVAGEPGGSLAATRARLAALWPGARVFDHHGMTEVGPVSYECPCQPGVLHVLESAYLAEIVDPASGQPVNPGTTGELVLTTLDRVGSPLLRYRTGDLVQARPTQTCACGRDELALVGGILGRSDDMLVVRGVNLYPSAVENIVRAFNEVAEYRVHLRTQRALCELSLQVEPLPECPNPPDLARRLEQALQAAFNLRIPVTPVAPGALPRFEMKAQRWVRETD